MDRQNIGRMAGVEREIALKYESEIKRIIIDFEHEKNAYLEEHNLERQRLKELYEYTLANKEDLFNRKL